LSIQRRVALLGGSGFVGTRLAKLLESLGYDVLVGDLVVPLNAATKHTHCNVLDRESIVECIRGCDLVYLLAAEHRDDVSPVERYYRVNCSGAENVCSAMSELNISGLVFTSSAAVYGYTGDEPVDEDRPRRPFNHYGKSKARAEGIVSDWQRSGPERMLAILRPTVVFGPGNRGNVYTLAREIARGRFLMIGAGANRKSMAFVDNVAAALEWAANRPPGRWVYNYADEPDVTTRDLVSLVCEHLRNGVYPRRVPKFAALSAAAVLDAVAYISGRRFPISRVRIEKFCSNTRFSAAKIRAAGFWPPISLRDGLLAMLHEEFSSSRQGKDSEARDERESAQEDWSRSQQPRVPHQHATSADAGNGTEGISGVGICSAPERRTSEGTQVGGN
jgi:nucleoside-diphosphate-sugar epimerase